MPDLKAEQIIKMAETEKSKAQNFLNLYQQVADLMYPLENQITSQSIPGRDKSLDVRDPTGITALDRATAGFIGAWIPRERFFFGIKLKNRIIAEISRVKTWCALAVQIAHDEMFESNFMQQLHPTTKATIGFGTGNLYSEWDRKEGGLNYKDHHISTYTIKQNSRGRVDTNILSYDLTARQATEEFSDPGEKVIKAAGDTKTESDKFPFIHIVRPRLDRNVMFVDNLNMPWESVFVNVKDKITVEEGGFPEFPFAVPRWERSSCEKYGRGRGVAMLSAVKDLQQMRKDFTECGNRWNKPTLEVVDNNVEGEVTITPGEINHVTEIGSIKGLSNQIAGNFPITREMLEFQQEMIKNDGFYNDIFSQFRNLQGDRRVTLELELREEEGLEQLVSPATNYESELFTPLITRSILLLVRNGRIPYPPPELRGQSFGIEYMGKLAMAMKKYQAKGFMQFAQLIGSYDAIFPEAKDVISIDRALPDIAVAMGMKVEHMSTEEEKVAKRQARAQLQQQQMMMQAAMAAGKAYKDASGTAEEGSPAETVMAGA